MVSGGSLRQAVAVTRVSLLVVLELFCGVGMATANACMPDETVMVGTDGTGIRSIGFDACTGDFNGEALVAVAEVSKTRWLVRHPQLPVVYAAAEGTPGQGQVLAYAVPAQRGPLQLLGSASSGGAGPTYLWLDVPSRTLLTANFGSGSVSSLDIGADGKPGALTGSLTAQGSGPHQRQATAHAHGIALDTPGQHALVADMGADRVWIYGFDRDSHRLEAQTQGAHFWQASAGSGPRRAIFGKSDRYVYVLGELDAQIAVLRWDAGAGALHQVQALALSTPEAAGGKSASEMVISQDGRFLYVANRGQHQLQVYQVHPDGGLLTLVQTLESGGKAPWAFDIHASGRWMLVANYRSNRLSLFGIDAVTGLLSDVGKSVETPAPVSVLFVN